jgi:hypothetical protein
MSSRVSIRPSAVRRVVERITTMRFMMLMYPGQRAELGALPDEKVFAAIMKYNEELTKAGVLLALDGLMPTAKGVRVRVASGQRTVTEGPFSEATEVLGGYWLIQVRSREEAVEWASRVPLDDDEMVELRQVFEPSDFSAEVQKLAALDAVRGSGAQ